MGHRLPKKVNFYFIFSEKLILRGKCHWNARIMLNAFASLKCWKRCWHNVQKPTGKYLYVGRIKIQISPTLGEQDQSNALPFPTPGLTKTIKSPPHSLPPPTPLLPTRLYIDRCISFSSLEPDSDQETALKVTSKHVFRQNSSERMG